MQAERHRETVRKERHTQTHTGARKETQRSRHTELEKEKKRDIQGQRETDTEIQIERHGMYNSVFNNNQRLDAVFLLIVQGTFKSLLRAVHVGNPRHWVAAIPQAEGTYVWLDSLARSPEAMDAEALCARLETLRVAHAAVYLCRRHERPL